MAESVELEDPENLLVQMEEQPPIENKTPVTKKFHKCKIVSCGFTCNGVSTLKLHYSKEHNDALKFECLCCKKRFLINKYLHTHLKKCGKRWICEECREEFGTQYRLLIHKCAKKIIRTPPNATETREEYLMKKYNVTTHFCENDGSLSDPIEQFIIQDVAQPRKQIDKGLICDKCKETFKTKAILKAHLCVLNSAEEFFKHLPKKFKPNLTDENDININNQKPVPETIVQIDKPLTVVPTKLDKSIEIDVEIQKSIPLVSTVDNVFDDFETSAEDYNMEVDDMHSVVQIDKPVVPTKLDKSIEIDVEIKKTIPLVSTVDNVFDDFETSAEDYNMEVDDMHSVVQIDKPVVPTKLDKSIEVAVVVKKPRTLVSTVDNNDKKSTDFNGCLETSVEDYIEVNDNFNLLDKKKDKYYAEKHQINDIAFESSIDDVTFTPVPGDEQGLFNAIKKLFQVNEEHEKQREIRIKNLLDQHEQKQILRNDEVLAKLVKLETTVDTIVGDLDKTKRIVTDNNNKGPSFNKIRKYIPFNSDKFDDFHKDLKSNELLGNSMVSYIKSKLVKRSKVCLNVVFANLFDDDFLNTFTTIELKNNSKRSMITTDFYKKVMERLWEIGKEDPVDTLQKSTAEAIRLCHNRVEKRLKAAALKAIAEKPNDTVTVEKTNDDVYGFHTSTCGLFEE